LMMKPRRHLSASKIGGDVMLSIVTDTMLRANQALQRLWGLSITR
jgi:hypothetical protein